MFIYENTNPELILIHLHGFASDVKGNKIKLLVERSKKGVFSFFAMDMDYQTTTTTKTLEVLDALVKGFSQKFKEIWLSGSSHGGYIALNYLRFYTPEKVSKVFLFAPSYSTLSLTLQEVGREKCEKWLKGEEELHFIECETGLEITIHKDFAVDIEQKGYEIIQDSKVNFPKDPKYHLYIFHGTFDRIVPIDHSRLFVREVKVQKYVEVEDDHRLSNTFSDLIEGFM
ncbi:MAG: YqiA/YcfP family alpha/beta fold hydrolase [Aquificaceae bacterium]